MKFLGSFVFFVFMLFLVWAGVVFGQSNNPTAMSQWVYDAYEKKYNIAKDIKEKKIIILAGSNTLFGVDSKLLAEEFGMRVVNYGVNAGVELPYTLFAAKKVIQKGDIVLVPLEYPMYSYDATPGAQMIDYIFSREAPFFFELTLREQFYMLWHIDLKRVWDGYFNQSGKSVTEGVYGAHNIDENGDQINTSLKYRSDGMFNEINALKANSYGKEFERGAIGWSYLEEFVRWCKKHKARVVFMPSTLMKNEHYFNDAKERWFYENIANEVKKRGWEYVGNPYEYMYEKEFYFNTDFHLTDVGKAKRTKQMILDLKSAHLSF